MKSYLIYKVMGNEITIIYTCAVLLRYKIYTFIKYFVIKESN